MAAMVRTGVLVVIFDAYETICSYCIFDASDDGMREISGNGPIFCSYP